MKRKITKLLLTGAMMLGVCGIDVQAMELEEPKQMKTIMYTFDESDICAATQQLAEEENTFPVYAEGNHTKWIDRLEWPWYGTHFYNKILVEGTDNDGVNDYFIDQKNNNAVGLISLWAETENGEWVEKQVPAIIIHNGLYAQGPGEEGALEVLMAQAEEVMDRLAAAYGAFQMDHPEVFWLNNSLRFVIDDMSLVYDDLYDVSIARGSLYLVLEMDYEGNTYTFNHTKYTDKNVLRQAIADMNEQIDTIVNEAATMDTVSKIKYYNNWLVMNNERNTFVQTEEQVQKLYETNPEAFSCISALYGNTGDKAPVSEAYARAFKVLCDRSDIPCVLSSSIGDGHDAGSIHLWNNVQIDGNWYAVDVACNEPEGGASGAVSGMEQEDYVLVGKNTEFTVGEEIFIFGESHEAVNLLTEDSVSFINGPELSDEAYMSIIDKIILTASADSFYPEYDEYPVITAEVIKAEDVTSEAEYTWYLKGEDGSFNKIEGETRNSIVFPEVENGGTYTLVLEVKVGNCKKSASIDIAAVKFNDLHEKSWYYNAVQWALENGIAYGYTVDTFGIYISCSRAQVVTFMWRAAGCPEPEHVEMSFVDVAESDYFYKAVQWAVSKGITSGYSREIFAPDDSVTRAQFVSFLWRENGKPISGEDGDATNETDALQTIVKFTDISDDAYYYDAAYWAVRTGITSGYTNNTFAPDNVAVRAEIVTFLWRADKNLIQTEVS